MSVVNSPQTQDHQADVRPTPEEPIDFTVVREAARRAEGLALNACTREEFFGRAEVLTETVRRLLREDHPDQSTETLTAYRGAYRLVDHPARPTSNDSAFRLHQHVRNLARSAAMLADVLDPQAPAPSRFVARPGLPPERRPAP
ncbi:hypothetical protein [Streptomyces sp. cg35]|uniref:hypothetical protein n=1 Tax=Streptomyces sp. cg35 TaxID=3421650 RepID=UPI003D162420